MCSSDLSYAKERKQGKTNNTKSTNGADFIIEHADIRKSLLNMKSIIEGERALCFWLSQQTEVSLYHPDEKIKQEASDIVSLMTPVVKTMFSDMGMEITSEAMQVHGGYGYTKDQGIEQLYRDNRITSIYEGTNSIQAADLVFRKLVNKNGDIMNNYLELIKNDWRIENEILKTFIKKLKKANIPYTDAKVYAMPNIHQIYLFDPNANIVEINQNVWIIIKFVFIKIYF